MHSTWVGAIKSLMSGTIFGLILAMSLKDNSEHSSSEARRERSELYGREYDQGKVTYNDIYFQQ